MNKKWLLPLLILVMGLYYIFFTSAMIFKLIPMWLILLYAYQQQSQHKDRYLWITLCGLFFCMVGDYSLQWFVIGLTAFLIGHLFYVVAFATRWSFSWPRALTLIPIVAYGIIMTSQLLPALQERGDQVLVIPVIAYLIVISTMSWLAIMTGNVRAIIGAILFMTSDSILAWNMFVEDVMYSKVLIMSTYYAAQFLIASSIGRKQSLRVKFP